MKSLSDTCRDKAPAVSSSPFFYILSLLRIYLASHVFQFSKLRARVSRI